MFKYVAAVIAIMLLQSGCVSIQEEPERFSYQTVWPHSQFGARPLYLINSMAQSPLKEKLKRCITNLNDPFKRTDFSIGHRGAPRYFPEHTQESYEAAALMGAGIIECDVTFTKDKELVCRHSQCDLQSTTNILKTALAEKCSLPFQPAVIDTHGNLVAPATARCCTSDITLAEFKSLQGRLDTFNPHATTVAEYLSDAADKGTMHYATVGTLLSHQESIALFKKLNVKMMPELKSPSVPMPFDGFSQTDYARKMIDEYRKADVPASNVWAQSFNIDDVVYWIENEPDFGRQAVYLDGRYDDPLFDHRNPETWTPSMTQLAAKGVSIIAPPIWMLLEVVDGKIMPSRYANAAKAAGLEIVTWTLERDGSQINGNNWFFQTLNGQNPNPESPGNTIQFAENSYTVLHGLTREVGIIGIFSDWPATVSYYANCMNLN
ncbi:MAG: glycerophosphodiester phosphodiesterase [Nitrosomonas sp.]|nr:glycerophosphodiester phosphodiesterase [Nitrosomonas sp.]